MRTAGDNITISLEGDAQLRLALSEIRNRARRVLPKVVRAAGAIISPAVKAAAPKKTGVLARSVTVKLTSSRPNVAKLRVGFKPPGFRYPHLVEFGHKLRRGKAAAGGRGTVGGRAGSFRGSMGAPSRSMGRVRGYPFMGPAWAATKDRAEAAMLAKLREEVLK